MLLIERLTWILKSATKGLIVAFILLMIIRMIVDAMDLNPFGATHRTVRRLTDSFVAPVRGLLRQFYADPKYAPILVIVIVILMGLLAFNLIETLSHTAMGVTYALQIGSLTALLGFIFHGLISIYILMIFVRIVLTMAMVSYVNRTMRFLVDATEPLLGPLRKKIPPIAVGKMGARWDISPLVAFVLLWLLQAAISATLLRGLRF
jgi:uncharacterized protein YggT (Ycf19 family)